MCVFYMCACSLCVCAPYVCVVSLCVCECVSEWRTLLVADALVLDDVLVVELFEDVCVEVV